MAPRLTKTITIRVTPRHIGRASRGCSTCPTALAIGDRGFGVAVGDRSATVSIEPGVFAEYRLPRAGRELARQFEADPEGFQRTAEWAMEYQGADVTRSFRITRMV